ncbi:MAG: hypothetical protein AB8G17_16465 [Gammaproteobacteria bacterium]
MQNHVFIICAAVLTVSTTVTFAQGSGAPRAALPDELQSAHESAKQQLRGRGYFEQLDRVPESEYVLTRIEQRRVEFERQNRALNPEDLGYYSMEQYDARRAPFKLHRVPNQVVRAGSKNYVLPSKIRVRRIYTQTEFGTLLVEQGGGGITLDEPNVDIGGQKAKLVTTRHDDDKWATTVYASGSGFVFRVEANRRLVGDELDRYLAFVTSIVTDS